MLQMHTRSFFKKKVWVRILHFWSICSVGDKEEASAYNANMQDAHIAPQMHNVCILTKIWGPP